MRRVGGRQAGYEGGGPGAHQSVGPEGELRGGASESAVATRSERRVTCLHPQNEARAVDGRVEENSELAVRREGLGRKLERQLDEFVNQSRRRFATWQPAAARLSRTHLANELNCNTQNNDK